MAAIFWSAMNSIYFLIIISIFSIIPSCLSQFISPQNIQTFYPFFLPPLEPPRLPIRPPVQPPPPPPPPPTEPLLPPPLPPLFFSPPPSTPSKKAVGTAIGVTAASTIVLSALFFFFLLRYLRSRREKGGTAVTSAAAAVDGSRSFESRPSGGGTRDEFLRFKGNLKGVIVDEDGLDVLYWRKLEGGEGKQSFNKQVFSNIESGGKDDRKKITAARGGGRIKPGRPVQETPLLRGKSSTSQDPNWAKPSAGIVFKDEDSVSDPPPPLSVEAIGKTTPPPPPKPGGFASSSSPELGISRNIGEELRGDKVNVDFDHSYKFDGDLMEALFGSVATNRKSPRTDHDDTSLSSPTRDILGPQSQIFILEPKRSEEIADVVKSLGVTRKEIIAALNNGTGLNAETLQKLSRISPTQAEESDILAFEGPPTLLADAESFLFCILKAHESAFPRFRAMFLKSNFAAEIMQLKERLRSLESACGELRGNRVFSKLLEAILKAWNRMSSGGDSRGFHFHLKSLRKLSDVKSIDGKTTVLQFVVQEVIRSEGKRNVLSQNLNRIKNDDEEKEKEYMKLGLPVIGGLSSEFPCLKKISAMDNNALESAHSTLYSTASEIRKILEENNGEGGFAREMKRFLDAAEEEMRAAREEQMRVLEMVKKTTEHYQTGASYDQNWQQFQLFAIVKDFLGMVDEACIEISRNLQKKKVSGAGSSSSSSRTVKFPKLGADFLREDS